MSEPNLDVKPAADPSPAADMTAVETASDALGDSSTPQSETAASDKPKQTMEDVVLDAYKKSVGDSPQEEVEPEADKEVVGEKEGAKDPEAETTEEEEARLAKEKKVEKPEGETEDAPEQEETKKEDDKGPVPYERFQEVVEKHNKVETRLKEIEPVAAQHQQIVEYCDKNGISPEQFSMVLEMAALFNTDPTKALAKLTPIMNELQGFTGDKLPEDLQVEVDGGEITLARAKEIAQLRSHQNALQKSGERQQKQDQQRREQEFQFAIAKAAESWEAAKTKSDPDYKPKAKETDPDGKWELTKDKFLALLHQQDAQGKFVNPIRTPQDLSLLMEKAYTQVNDTFGAFRKNHRPMKPLTRTGSSETAPKSPLQAKTIDEAMRLAAAKHGIR